LDLVFRLNDLRALPDDGIGRLEKIALSLDHHGSAVPPPLRLYADLVTGAAYTQHGDIQLAEAPMKRAYQLLNAGPADVSENPGVLGQAGRHVLLRPMGDEAGQHDVSTALWDEIYRLRKASLGAASVRNDEVIDPELDAIRSRIMGADLSGASERLARVKQQLGAGQPTLVNIHWDAGVEALALELLLDIESGKMPEAKRLIGERWHGATKNPFSDLLIYTLCRRDSTPCRPSSTAARVMPPKGWTG